MATGPGIQNHEYLDLSIRQLKLEAEISVYAALAPPRKLEEEKAIRHQVVSCFPDIDVPLYRLYVAIIAPILQRSS